MGLFKKSSKDKPDKSDNSNLRPDIEKIISADNINSSLIDLYSYLLILCNYGKDIEKLNAYEKVFYLNQVFEMEVNTDGLNAFFWNSYGDYTYETVNSLKEIGAFKTAEILEKAIFSFPDNVVSKDIDDRQNILDENEDMENVLSELLDKFLAYEDDLLNLNFEYIKKNKANF